MSITAIDLCSRAVLLIGANAIQSFEDGTRESNVCSSIYELVRDTLFANRDKFHPNMEIWNRDITSVSDQEIEALKEIDGIIRKRGGNYGVK